ncbi:hypothetical protein Sjap_009142 [Stephania japonica]|uniref:DDE Tnp4 domain-containing protein n=1 Tax=Stephania japonica TaxID=461633 RepID=A0AAP0PBH5_9MAGN
MRGFLTPYRNVCYWLPDYRNGVRARNKEEVFNYAHSSLRNVIKRSFGVLKARFPILRKMTPNPFPVQRSIVFALMAIHNFIRKEAKADKLFRRYNNEEVDMSDSDDDDDDDDDEEEEDLDSLEDSMQVIEMSIVREQIADELYTHV